MHRCLAIPELVAVICSKCDKPSLARLGCTARLFDCALDALWSGSPRKAHPHGSITITYLVQCFPRDVCARLPKRNCYSLLAPLEQHHWQRFNFYATRVRYFLLDTRSIDPTFLAVLGLWASPEGLLPNLKSLTLRSSHEKDLIHARAFLSSQLKELRVTLHPEALHSSGISLSSFLLIAPTFCADMTELELCIPGALPNPAVPTLLKNLRHLRLLALNGIFVEHLPLITNLPDLNRLTLRKIQGRQLDVPSGSTTHCDALMHVDLAASPNHALALFGLLPKCSLESLILDICEPMNVAELAEIVRVVTDRCQTHSLRRVAISQAFLPNITPIDINGDHLAPFLHFPNITRFDCHPLGSMLLDDTFILDLAKSWHQLAYLTIETQVWRDFQQYHPPKVTAQSLARLAFHCPRLSHIGLDFDATIPLPIPDTCNASVRSLAVGCSLMGEPNAAVRYLLSLFPNIAWIGFTIPESMEPQAREVQRERWHSVVDMVDRKQQVLDRL